MTDPNPIMRMAADAMVALDLGIDDPRYLELVEAVGQAQSVDDLPEWIRKAGTRPEEQGRAPSL